MKKSWATEQAIAMLAVDNIKVPPLALELLAKIDAGEISYDEAKKIIIQNAKDKSNKLNSPKD